MHHFLLAGFLILLTPQKSMEEAARLKAMGRTEEAVKLWEEVWTKPSGSPLSADALYLAAESLEEVGSYGRSQELLDRLLREYPSHRLAPRARQRLGRLREERRTGDAPLREYQDILNRFYQLEPEEAILKMEGVVDRYPEFALRARAALWLGARNAEMGRLDQAVRWFDRCFQFHPSGEETIEALEGKGAALLRQHRYNSAREVFESMKPLRPEATLRAEGLIRRSRAHEMRRNIFFLGFLPFQVACISALAFFMPWRSLTVDHLKGGLRDALFVAPLLLALYLILARRNPFTARGILVMLALVPPVIVLNSLYAQAGPIRGAIRRLYPWLGLLFMAGVVYGILYGFDLVFVLEQIWGGEVEWN